MKAFNERQTTKSPKVVSFSETLISDIPILSHVAGSTLAPNKKKKTPSPKQTMTPRTKSKTKSKAFMQQEIEKEKMMTHGQGLGEELNFLDTQDGDVQLIESPKLNQPKFMTPPRGSQGMTTTPMIPSWLSNSVCKKQNLLPMSTPVKVIATKYATRGSKSKKMKSDVRLIKDPITERVKKEVATYKQKDDSGEIDAKGFKVTTLELGAITRDTGNHFFKFFVDHMLTQSERDRREKKELKELVITMATYVDSLMNLGALPLVQTSQSFDPNSSDGQQLVKQMQRGKLLSNAIQEWVASIVKEGSKFILDFTTMYAEGEVLLGEIQTLVPIWEADENRCQAIEFQVHEVEKYEVLKFMNENPMKTVDSCMIFILKRNMGWKESIYKGAIE